MARALQVTLPPEFSEAAARICLDFCYTDAAALAEDSALPALALAVFLSLSHLATLCTRFIVQHIQVRIIV